MHFLCSISFNRHHNPNDLDIINWSLQSKNHEIWKFKQQSQVQTAREHSLVLPASPSRKTFPLSQIKQVELFRFQLVLLAEGPAPLMGKHRPEKGEKAFKAVMWQQTKWRPPGPRGTVPCLLTGVDTAIALFAHKHLSCVPYFIEKKRKDIEEIRFCTLVGQTFLWVSLNNAVLHP